MMFLDPVARRRRRKRSDSPPNRGDNEGGTGVDGNITAGKEASIPPVPGGGKRHVFYCRLCRVKMNAEIQAKQHFEGKTHARKISLQRICSLTRDPKNSDQSGSYSLENERNDININIFNTLNNHSYNTSSCSSSTDDVTGSEPISDRSGRDVECRTTVAKGRTQSGQVVCVSDIINSARIELGKNNDNLYTVSYRLLLLFMFIY